MNNECEKLLELYGVLQECDVRQQSEKKAAFDSALMAFAEKNGLQADRLRAFVTLKWDALNKAEMKRVGTGLGSGLPPAS